MIGIKGRPKNNYNYMKQELTKFIIVIVISTVVGFVYGRHSKQCPQPDPIIRYVQVNHQINTIQNEIDSIDLIISSPNVTLSRSKRDSLRSVLNPR
jgi:type IV pilus biogenesis protein CpaD/CtpE